MFTICSRISQEFADIRRNMQWAGPYYGRPVTGGRYPRGIRGDWPDAHGTLVLSKLVGKVYGVVQTPSVVVVVRKPLDPSLEDFANMITWTIEDWVSNRDNTDVKVAVMNISFGFPGAPLNSEEKEKLGRIETLLVRALGEGILPIISAGNVNGLTWIWS